MRGHFPSGPVANKLILHGFGAPGGVFAKVIEAMRKVRTTRESNPSPDSRPLVKAHGASHPLPSEREKDVLSAPARLTCS